ncbi:alpha/beta fold hydrolase [bacterium]|nr:alpha/beta fold hydrolase [bacterium]
MLRRCKFEKEIRIDNGDAPSIHADIRTERPGEKLPVIILCHGFLGYKRWGWFPFVSRRIAARGFHTLTVSFSMNGTDEETGRITKPEELARDTFTREMRDLENVLTWIRKDHIPLAINRKSWGLFGHSRGGAVSILTTRRFEEVKSLVTWSAPSSLDRYTERRKKEWARTGRLLFQDSRADTPLYLNYSYYKDIDSNRGKYDIPVQAAKLKIPHLMIHGERDAAVSLKEAEKLIKFPRAGKMRFDIIKGCGHSFGVKDPMTAPTEELLSALAKTEDWFVKTLSE